MSWTATYRRHLRSPRWRYLKACIARSRGRRCERCGATYGLQLHHKTYIRLGHERPSDVELLCDSCHRRADLERTWQNTHIPQGL
jgi:5-methylcytosine-specific restriction endonuclease McrA